jgi:hypothetical protein
MHLPLSAAEDRNNLVYERKGKERKRFVEYTSMLVWPGNMPRASAVDIAIHRYRHPPSIYLLQSDPFTSTMGCMPDSIYLCYHVSPPLSNIPTLAGPGLCRSWRPAYRVIRADPVTHSESGIGGLSLAMFHITADLA